MAEGFAAFVEELLEPFGRVTCRRMFGGLGIYLGGRFVAIVWKDTLYLKASGNGKAACEAAGLKRFRPSSRTPGYSLGFYAPPDDALEDPDALRPWVEIALAAARSSPVKKAMVRHSAPN
ncbi:MAG: TfoX/Sxy family protein [Alphaproteobacteria bacterium]|nr:TfoX/Sxy family protein [Alphaproteobacteria bacterium]